MEIEQAAEFTFKQLAALGVGSLVVIALGAWIWYLMLQCKSKDAIIAKDKETILDLMDRYMELSKSSRESLQPVLSALTGVRDTLQEVRTIIQERIPRQGQ